MDATNVPVRVGGIEVAPGDYAVADEDGVAAVSGDRQQEVLASARAEQREERRLLRLIERYGSYPAAIQERATASDTGQRQH